MTKTIQSQTTDSGNDLYDLLWEITYVIPVEDGDPYEASFLQGFARSLMENVGIIRLINTLPSDIWELTPEGQEIRLPRRMSGQAPVIWRGQSPRALKGMVTPPFLPFMVLFLGREHKIETYRDWIDAHSFPLTVVAEKGGTITYKEFSLEKLKEAFLNICDTLVGQIKPDALETAREHLRNWREPEERDLGYKVGGHNVVAPNLFSLYVAGFRETTSGSFTEINEGITPYVEIIVQTTRSVLAERERISERAANQYFRRPPSLSLFAPSIYPHFYETSLARNPFTPEEKKGLLAVRRMLQRQDGYGFTTSNQTQIKAFLGGAEGDKPKPHPIILERGAELRLASQCVGTLSASEVSAVIRLPNAANRTSGQVRQFAQHYHAKRTTDRKRREAFRKVQSAITASVPVEFFEFIEGAKDGIRLITDANLEWMNVRGLPICVQKDITKVPVTPGNLFIEQVLPKKYLHLTTSDFEEILILSALDKGDPISRFFDIALSEFEPHFRNKIRVRTERIRNEEDLVAALNSYNGPMVIFDGHGGHAKDKPAELQLLEESIDIWQLQRKRPRVPPVVVLSACDTHAADRNHATTANGFLAIGARTVLGSVFPIDARDAASFVARLLYRVAEFVPASHKMFNQSLNWLEIMGGMIRMQLLTDFCRRMESKGLIDHETYKAIHLAGNMAINGGDDWPYETVVTELAKHGVDEKRAWHELRSAAANSTAISYLQMGCPETIIIHPDEGFRDEAQAETEANR
ncbi:CHAT domain-containing protein [Paracoccus saliphilus]|uniref:CHAT domain-containing protein n=1 Tax=Paracoccus saliphilus TaxID=405559 RepID=A0AA46A4C4_9RHOB|nr:CHAT domain-containing protein [Paracoccus saliphilus]WCR03757.1 CHAT domain-containing protein [Paracoccus saliphilus]SIS59116.1 CHAT domain-containing protein [Paracoccus saliphilus]